MRRENAFAPIEGARLFIRESHQLACSRGCLSAKPAIRSLSRVVFALGPEPAPAKAFKELTSLSTLPLEDSRLEALLHAQKTPTPAPVDTTTDVVTHPAFTTSTILSPVFKIFDFERTEYRANGLRADYPAQIARLTDPDHIKKLRAMVCGGR